MKWSDHEINLLEQNQHLNSWDMTSVLPERSYEAIVQKRNKLGLVWNGQFKWEDWEIDILEQRRYYTAEEISEQFLPHRSADAIRDKRNRVGYPQMVHCKDCGSSFVKNNQMDVCADCKKDHNYHNHSVLGKYRQYKHGAKRRGIDWSLTPDQFKMFWYTTCRYCGEEFSGVGIDRIDNDNGYYDDNCVPCCEICNEMKLDHTLSEWVDHMHKILKNIGEIR